MSNVKHKKERCAFGKRFTAVLLVTVMMLAMMPAVSLPVFAADDTKTTNDDFYRILHLDCGRKYFSKDWIIALINEMAAAGYNQLQLAFGNDGLRFLLDDMSVIVGDTTYSSHDVTQGIKSGNKVYYDAGDVNELTESDMNDIIAHATTKGIEIVPLLNSPGHMDAIINAMSVLGISTPAYSTSKTTVDLANETAVAFTQALVKKYVDYFASRNCKFFNIGADEYANDINSNPQFGNMLNNGYYEKFVTYLNTLAKYVVDKGMTPRCFNDGVYYNQNTNNGTPNDNLQVCYWSSGWSGFSPASSTFLANEGYKLINTNGDYYYVLGKENEMSVAKDYKNALKFSNNTFINNLTISDPVGSMFCIWCDFPNAQDETSVAANTRMILRVMAARMQNSNDYSGEDVIVPGGFNADGSINAAASANTSVSISNDNANSSNATVSVNGNNVTANIAEGGFAALTVNNASGKTVTVESSDNGVATAEVNGNSVKITAKSVGTATVTITVSDTASVATYAADDNATVFTVAVNVTDVTTNTNTVNVELNVGETKKYENITADAGSYITDNSKYIATAEVEKTESTTASINKNVISITSGSKYLILPNTPNSKVVTSNTSWGYNGFWTSAQGLLIQTVTINNNNIDNLKQYAWTITEKGNGEYTVQNSAGKYLNIVSNNTLILSDTEVTLNIGWSNGKAYFKNDNGCYLNNFGGGNTFASGYTETLGDGDRWTLYEVVEATTGKTNLTIIGTGEGTTNVTVGDTTYNITVTAPTESETKTVSCGETLALPDGATDVAVSGTAVTYANGKLTAADTAGTATVTFVTKNDGGYVTARYTYTVTVTEVDLSTISPLIIEYWITNSKVNAPTANDNTSYSLKASASGVYSEFGVEVKTFLPANGIKESRTLSYWRCRLLDKTKTNSSKSGTEEQVDEGGDDETYSGTGFTKVRYYNNAWAVYTENNEWVNVENKYQLVAYYLEIVPIQNENGETEIDVNAADWGTKGDGQSIWGYTPESNRCSVSIQVVYEDGSTNPAGTTASILKTKTILYGYWDNGRGLGTMQFNGVGDYEIYKVTAETGTMTSTTSGNYVTVTNLKWNEDEETVWEGDPSANVLIHNDSRSPDYSEPYDNLTWNTSAYNKNNAILIRVYVKTVETEANVKVVYYDEKFGDVLYSYFIDVPKGTSFDGNIVDTNKTKVAWEAINGFSGSENRKNVDGYGIQNKNEQYQWFQTDLTKVPEAVGKYHSDLYTYTGSELKDDGMTLYLYYTINTSILKPNFVIDFGLPITFNLSELVNGTDVVKSVDKYSAKYGTLEYDSTNQIFTYTPTQILPNVDILSITLTFDGETSSSTTNVGVTPASTVYYEENFITTDDNWKPDGTATSKTQTTEELGKHTNNTNNYGYDGAYTSDTQHSGGSAYKVTVSANNPTATASFTFTGNRFDLISSVSQKTGTIFVFAKNANKNVQKFWIVDSFYGIELANADAEPYVKYTWTKGTDGKWHVDNDKTEKVAEVPTGKVVGQFYDNEDGTRYSYASNRTYTLNATNEVLYQVPIISKTLDYGTWTVTVKVVYDKGLDHANQGSYDFYIDGVRIYNTLNDSSVYEADGENDPQFTEIRDMLINANSINDESKAENAAVFVDGIDSTTSVQDLKNYGPNDEVYLASGQAIAFKVDVASGKTYYIGAKSPNGSATMVVNGESQTIATATDMYYKVTPTDEGYIVVANNGTGILSLTTIKAVGGSSPSPAVASYSVDSDVVAYACAMVLDMVQPAPVFEPETLEASWTTIKFFSFASHTLSVSTSADVEYITVGECELHNFIYTYKFEGSGWNRKLVKYKLFTLTLGSEAELGDYSVVAYNAEGSASAPITATLTGNVGVGKFN